MIITDKEGNVVAILSPNATEDEIYAAMRKAAMDR